MIANAINSIIPGFRDRSSLTAPVRNGAPPHAYITVPRTGDTHLTQAASGSEYPSSMANIVEKATTGTASASMIQNSRRNCPT
ncbi:hypothetical protein GCM10010910_22840 [Microbacterium nanhaiense]|uniref:Uncharacterized protein n=1 Tax=Microbacterium nanhaiense TaxID=1301026 RepID=A0ABQ2N1Y2_9MICO|nr:hypothetical protein GCM10010910_22840 [Microbacterium nanhaiense]